MLRAQSTGEITRHQYRRKQAAEALEETFPVGLQTPPRQLALACEKSHIAARRLKAEDRWISNRYLLW
jgi:hypothetical protein